MVATGYAVCLYSLDLPFSTENKDVVYLFIIFFNSLFLGFQVLTRGTNRCVLLFHTSLETS